MEPPALQAELDRVQVNLSGWEQRRVAAFAQRTAFVAELDAVKRRLIYFGLLHGAREFATLNRLWVEGLVGLTPLVVGVLAFSFAYLLSDRALESMILGVAFGVGGLAWLTNLFIYPDADRVRTDLERARARERELNAAVDVCLADVRRLTEWIEIETRRRDGIAAELARVTSINALAVEPWRDLAGVEFENYLKKVFLTFGYNVETTAVSGDHGVDLVVSKGNLRVAVQAKGYRGSVGNAAVQEAVAGMRMYGCNACAAVTNSRFTNGAIALAAANQCALVDENNFVRFITGELDLARMLGESTAPR